MPIDKHSSVRGATRAREKANQRTFQMREYVLTLTLAWGLAGIVNASAMAQKAPPSLPSMTRRVGPSELRHFRQRRREDIDCARSENLPPGEHAVHVHQMAKCDVPNIRSAGPHFNPDGKQHGLQNPQGPHAGDMNNFTVAANGVAKTTVVNPRVTPMTGGNSVFVGDGTALVIHAQADDMKSDPAGNAGDRIACGLIDQIDEHDECRCTRRLWIRA